MFGRKKGKEFLFDSQLWGKAAWSGMTYAFTPEEITAPFLGLGFRDVDAGRSIFRGESDLAMKTLRRRSRSLY